MTNIVIPIIALGGLGAFFGLGLALASKKFHVETDPKLEKICGLLPGANCGACGKAGCFGFAEAVASGGAEVDACRACDDDNKEHIAALVGKKLDKRIKTTAQARCNGGTRVQDRFRYFGMPDCIAAHNTLKGHKACVFGCLGFGTCVAVCPFGALSMSAEGLPVVDESACKSCGKCVAVCPRKLFRLLPADYSVWVACASHDMGREVKAVCSVGCISCRLCERACPAKAIKVIDNLAVIDYALCTSCGACVAVCPAHTIHKK